MTFTEKSNIYNATAERPHSVKMGRYIRVVATSVELYHDVLHQLVSNLVSNINFQHHHIMIV